MINKIKIFVLCFGVFISAVYAADNPAAVAFTDPMKSIMVTRAEPTFAITIQSNPTTGYSWSLKNYDSIIIVPVSHKFVPPTNKKLVGAPGYELWTFKVRPIGFVVPQTTNITLIYSRPWDDQGAQATSFKVITHDH